MGLEKSCYKAGGSFNDTFESWSERGHVVENVW